MFAGMLLSTLGSSMIWPFLTVYASRRLEMPLTAIAGLFTVNSAAGVVSSFLSGPVIDRFGRKWMMVAGLLLNGAVFIALSRASSYPAFLVLMALFGGVGPIFRVAADAMLADLIPAAQRPDAYALLRWSANLGISIGPAVGGFIASSSYDLAFYLAAAGMCSYSLLVLFFARETIPDPTEGLSGRRGLGGYGNALRNPAYMGFLTLVTLGTVPAILIWILMPVVATQDFGIPEKLYGLIPTTNALMVVLLQVLVTRSVRRFPQERVMALGAAFYAAGAGLVALAGGFWGFWVSIFVMTFGELLLAPTSSSYASLQAPPDQRGRYMSLYNLTWPVAAGIGPVFGGLLSDTLGAWAPWVGGLLMGLLGAAGFLWLSRQRRAAGSSAIQSTGTF
jgi:MFS family permease